MISSYEEYVNGAGIPGTGILVLVCGIPGIHVIPSIPVWFHRIIKLAKQNRLSINRLFLGYLKIKENYSFQKFGGIGEEQFQKLSKL